MATQTKKALVLSGGGGRGAYQAGVIAGLVEAGWMADGQGPDYIAGTSIGALNGVALAAGKTVADFHRFWTSELATDLVHDESQFNLALWLIKSGFLSPQRDDGQSGSVVLGEEGPPPDAVLGVEVEPPGPGGVIGWVAGKLRERLLSGDALIASDWDRVVERLALDWARVNSPAAPELLVIATDIQSGAPVVFRNRRDGATNHQLTPAHIRASASIQAIYPPTEIDGRFYWDGAVTNNTPLDPLLDRLAPDFDGVEFVTVLMTPWGHDIPPPASMYTTFAPALDWMLLASYRASVKRLSDRFLPGPRVIAPTPDLWREMLNIDRIFLYDQQTSAFLFDHGRADALAALG